MRFVDANVLLYAVSTAAEERGKARVARELLEGDDLALSVQVLQEFYVQATHAARAHRLSHPQAVKLVDALLRFPVQETTVSLAVLAMEARQRHGISYWDAAIIAAAKLLGCVTVLSEDLSDGGEYDGIRVENPFRACR